MSTTDSQPTDDASTDDDPDYTYHTEPPAQGGERYTRCERCGTELLTALGGKDNMLHSEGCPNQSTDRRVHA